ncbi:cadherin-12a [Carassius carassius]|uniref:cadherin-12a n=1 Tax=Carassius carassius TaxID=217509 RepID=UPI0028696DEF|nr:cadherin-12a [Carassius carassius]
MLMGNCLLLFLWCLLDKSFVSPLHSSSQSRMGKEQHRNMMAHRKHGMMGVHRVKRGWVWNQFFVLEEYMGSDPQYVGKLHSDLDKGDSMVKYTLSGEGVGSIFTIEPSTGDIHALRSLDREEKSYYTLRAQAVDVLTGRPLEPESEFIIKVQDINDNEPRFLEGPYSASVPEMSPVGTYVTQITATDADDPTYGNSARIVYSILHGQPYFSVDPKTGIIRVALPNMDREVKEMYQVVIQAKDMGGQLGGLAGTTTINITLRDVNDNPPRFSKSIFHLRVPESSPVGSSVGRVKAHDLDSGKNAEVEYSIVPGDGGSMFDIYSNKNTQEGTVILKKRLDYETRKAYTFKVEASNAALDHRFLHLGPFKDTATVKVNVLDVEEPPVFSRMSYRMETYEDTPVGIIVGAVTAEDLDVGNSPVRYSVERRKDSENHFDIDPVEGTLSVNEALDRERNTKHNVTVVATKVNNPLLSSKVTVTIKVLDVNEFPPELAFVYETFVCENAKVGQVIQIISATDRDMPAVEHRFYFKSPSQTRNRNFTIRDYGNNTAGVVTRRGGFRRLEQSMYLVPVIVEDGGYPIRSSTGTVSVRVCTCDTDGSLLSCNAEAVFFPMGLSTGALMAILLCIVILLVMVVLYIGLRKYKKKDTLMSSKEDIRDNVIHYDDEGGGEEDTQAFDIGTLRNPKGIKETVQLQNIRSEDEPNLASACMPNEDSEDIRNYIHHCLLENSAPPYDSLVTYAYEGQGSVAESLSSIESWVLEPKEDCRNICDWGPRFKTLAGIFKEHECKDTEKTENEVHAEALNDRMD